jgi:hypothetical protein
MGMVVPLNVALCLSGPRRDSESGQESSGSQCVMIRSSLYRDFALRVMERSRESRPEISVVRLSR